MPRLFGYKLDLLALIGIGIITTYVILALAAPLIAPFGEAEIVGDAWAPIDEIHWLGTDNLGRDLFSRLLYGGRVSIGLSVAITCLCFLIGVCTGLMAAVMGGMVDLALCRLVDLMLSIPTLIFVFIILSGLGTDLYVLILTIALIDSTKVFRLSRSVALGLVVMEFVDAARARGEGFWWIMRAEILPNALSPLIAEFGLRFCFTFLFVAALSFLGLGVQPPNADWGSMVKDYADVINLGLLAPLIPAGAIALLTIGVNFVADWLLRSRDAAPGAS
jgi:peptide/nickel transport system permease protein